MNKKNLNKYSPIMSVVLIAALILAGCGKKEGTGASNTPTDTKGKYESPVALKMVRRADGNPFSKVTNEIIKNKMKERYNIDLTIDDIEKSVYDEKTNVLFASGSLPDILNYGDVPKIAQGVESGAFVDFEDIMKNDPQWAKVDKRYFSSLKYGGKHYSLPEMRNLPETLYYRVDWAKKLGLKEPTNANELYDFLYAFAKKDPDGNKKDDTYGFSMPGDFNSAYGIWNVFLPITPNGTALYVDSKDNSIKSALYLTEDIKAALSWFRKAYSEGVLDKEYVISKSKEVEDKFVQGKTGVWQKGVQWITPRYTKMKEKFPEVELYSLATIKGKYGANYRVPQSKSDGFFVSSKSKDTNRAKLFVAYYASLECVMDRTVGEKGKEYDIENGQIKWMNEDGKKSYNPGNILSSVFDVKLPAPDPVLEKNMETLKGYELTKEISSYVASSTTNQNKGADIAKIIQDHLTKIIMGVMPVDSYDSIYSELRKAGLDEIVKEVDKAYKDAQK